MRLCFLLCVTAVSLLGCSRAFPLASSPVNADFDNIGADQGNDHERRILRAAKTAVYDTSDDEEEERATMRFDGFVRDKVETKSG
ncbi:hypothetical protein JG687_00007279 [Phytophthora cactorum]|uniref:RxLR effector protein n=1 Tax=Phytophthora cactorum TaxID=29920 RepID=A0A329RZU3_9STRA|nr:hypothetical protein Pcac1_g1747 [Phytophthora cactorum]KAG2820623.1 hypothetical protein PC112_g11703 [Phytophthora cactorum]KAG2822752.1 hypothetical protein PC111_g10507 [Phytophthora cactorum]KAG2855692.1 hypothetical protein PC113_g12229 [Phytophthora cactorum]KAG2902186.1 hypothetical protein PC114_g12843 [Phytophthora cactorum]